MKEQRELHVLQHLTVEASREGKFRLVEGKHSGFLTWICHPLKSTPVVREHLKGFLKSIKKSERAFLTGDEVDAFRERLDKAGYRLTYASPEKLYHVTHPDSVGSILKDGLKGGTEIRNRGEVETPSIFTVVKDDDSLMQYVAINQIWIHQDLEAYSVLEIDGKGISGEVTDDDVAESSAILHRVIEQALIEPRYIKLLRTRTINYPGKKVLELMTPEKTKSEEPWTDEDWAIARKWLGPENPHLGYRRQIEDQYFLTKTESRPYQPHQRMGEADGQESGYVLSHRKA